jgi:hypothetical protein
METLKIDILNPKARKLLRSLADQNLIAIRDNKPSAFRSVLKNLRSQANQAPDLESITSEVEKVRARRYSSK